MASPFQLQVVAKVERKLNSAAFYLIRDDAVINSLDGNFPAIPFIEQTVPSFDDRARVDDADAEYALRGCEIVTCLLLPGIDFQQRNIFRVMLSHNRLTEEPIV